MSPPPSFSTNDDLLHADSFIEENNFFLDNLKDLKNMGTQIYSAADYFESSYKKTDDDKSLIVGTLKDYIGLAIVNTIDHLGSVSFKLDDILKRRLDQITQASLHVSFIEHALRTCLHCVDRAGLSQQTLEVINIPKYHKRYILPVGEAMPESGRQALEYMGDDQSLLCSEIRQKRAPSIRRVISRCQSFDLRSFPSSPSSSNYHTPLPPSETAKFLFPDRKSFPQSHSKQKLTGTRSLLSFKSTILRSPKVAKKFSMDLLRSNSMRENDERGNYSNETNPNKFKVFIKSLIKQPSKTKKDDDTFSDFSTMTSE
ncbi:hypothetical protein ZOSMA_2G01540 [Zostera marina]|uniref:Protein ABIL2 n=1 Tax=Zostera marina TaxID=29655 RepID=A0A0K9PD39_ZOSMR|nr:hypothetical protein ZOSMA_2G01540 [Zostera marina]